MQIKRGHLYVVDFNPRVCTKPGKLRPALVVQSNLVNEAGYPSTIVIPTTSKLVEDPGILRFRLHKGTGALDRDSDLLLGQLIAVANESFCKEIGNLPMSAIEEIERLFCDHGSEFSSQLVDLWAYQHQVQIDVSRPGKPTDNAHVASFKATLRRECLNVHWFESLHEAQDRIEAWRREYNESRPHRALHDQTPAELAKRVAENLLREPVITAGDSP